MWSKQLTREVLDTLESSPGYKFSKKKIVMKSLDFYLFIYF